MAEQNGKIPALTPATVSVLEETLRARAALRPPAAAPPDADRLTRYLCGALSAEAAREVERSLTRHPDSRRTWREARAVLRILQALPWQEAAARIREEGLEGEVARAWMTLASERAEAAAHARTTWLAAGWEALRRQAAEGAAGAQAAWTAFMGAVTQWQAGLQGSRYALARGGEAVEVRVFGELPPGVRLAADLAEVDAAGTLHASVQARDAAGQPSAALAGRAARLALTLNGEIWPLAAGRFSADRAEWAVPGMGEAGLPEGLLTPDMLAVLLDDTPVAADTARALPAEVLDADGQPAEDPPVMLEMAEAPRWENGVFRVALRLPAGARAVYAGYRLSLDVAIAARAFQRLGVWRLEDWPEGARMLSAPCPGSGDAILPTTASLRAQLHPSSVPEP